MWEIETYPKGKLPLRGGELQLRWERDEWVEGGISAKGWDFC